MAEYGIPYMGSKQEIIKSLAMNFPKADHFYDLFGGGFSVTHYMLVNRAHQYKHFHYNEKESCTVELIKKAIKGEYSYARFKQPWVSRDDFFKQINDPYVRICWSFGNNQKKYMFSRQLVPYKKSMHQAIIFNQFDDLAKQTLGFDSWPRHVSTVFKKRLYLRQKIEWHRKKNNLPKCLRRFLSSSQLQRLEQLERLQQLQQMERLQRLQQMERLQQLQKLTFTSGDYRELEIRPNSVVYCDIPYLGTESYLGKFDHKAFYDWAMSRNFPVYVSEYSMPDKRFKLIYTVDKKSRLCNTLSKKTVKEEKLFWNGVSL